MNRVEFPPLNLQAKNISTYVMFAVNNFLLNGDAVTYNPQLKFATNEPGCVAFEIKINNKLAMIDLQDSPDEYRHSSATLLPIPGSKIYVPENLDMPIFKVAVRPNLHYYKNIYPYGPFHVWNNSNTQDLKKLLSYKNIFNPFSNNNLLCTAKNIYPKTRGKAFSKLDKNKIYSNINIVNSRVNQYAHWDRHNNCFGVLNISGSNINTVDKVPIEAMFLGAAVIHNNIDILLPYNKQLTKHEHYFCLADDYSDINEKINYLYDDREHAKEVGEKARNLMLETSTPEMRIKWMIQVIEEYYGN